MKKQTFNKLGLALAGGGGRGAYQVGVYRALLETKLFDKVQVMAGTSVGALNSMLFLHNDYQLATYLWRCGIERAILYLDKERYKKQFARLPDADGEMPDFFSSIKNLFTNQGFKAGIFSREGLIELLTNEIDLSLVHKTRKKVYATATYAATKNIEYFHLNNVKDKQELINILLASSALPAIFDRQYINNKEYYDGGIHNNVPLDILYEEGCDLIIVVHLYRSRDKISHERYPNAKIIELFPENSLGGLTGTLDFTPKSMRNFIARGYEENIDVLQAIGHRFKIKNRPSLF